MNIPSLVSSYISGVLPSMHGWCTPEKAETIAQHILTERPRVAVEIGVYAGRSLLAIALSMHCNNQGIVIGIDPWESSASVKGWENDDANTQWWGNLDHNLIYEKCREYVATMRVTNHVRLIKTTSDIVAPILEAANQVAGGEIVNFLHIDGNHSVEQSMRDVQSYLPLVSHGGIVCFDDVNWTSTTAAQEELLNHCDEIQRLDAGGQSCGFYRKR